MSKDKRDGMGWGRIQCGYCGGSHSNTRERRACRLRGGAPEPVEEPKVSAPRRAGNETTRYATDPLRGNPRAHAIAKQLRSGKKPRQVAKFFGVPMGVVDEIRRKVER